MQTFTARIHVPAVTLTSRAQRPCIHYLADDMEITVPGADRDAIGEPWGGKGLFPETDDLLLGKDGLWRLLTIGLTIDDFGMGPPQEVLSEFPDSVWDAERERFACRFDRPATGAHLAMMLAGERYPNRWLNVTRLATGPFYYDTIYTSLRYAADRARRPAIDPAAALDMRSRVADYVSGNMRWDGSRYWVRCGMPGVTRTGHVLDTDGQRLGSFERSTLFQLGNDWPVVPGRVEATLRLARRLNRPVDEDALRERLAPVERRLGGIDVGDDDVRVRFGHIVFRIFDEGVRSWGWQKTDEARALSPRIAASLATLAPYAALAALGALRRDEWGKGMDAAIEASLLLQRLGPSEWTANMLTEGVAYCEEVVMPMLGLDPEIDLPDVFA